MRYRASGFSFAVALLAAWLSQGASASAQLSQNWTWCNNKGNQFSPDLRISGCTAVIQSGRETSGNLAIAFNNRGNAYSEKGQYDRAIQDYDQAIRLEPSAIRFSNRGNAYRDKGQYDRAIQDYDQAIRLNPQYADAFNGRGIAYRNIGQYDRVSVPKT